MSLELKNSDTLCTHVYTDATKRALIRVPLPLDVYPKDQDRIRDRIPPPLAG